MTTKTFTQAFNAKHPNRAQILRMMCYSLNKEEVQWEDLTRVNLTTISDYIRDNVAPNSACTYLNIIKALLNDYSEEGIIPCRSFSGVLTGKKVPSQHVALTADELLAIDAYQPKSKTEQDVITLFMRACLTGCRCSDAIALTSNNITEGTLTYVSQKTKTEVSLPVHSKLMKYLDCPFSEHATSVINRTLRRICKRVEINEPVQLYVRGKLRQGPKYQFISMHTARRTFCTELAKSDVPVEVIRTLAGHSTSAMTDRYICIDGSRPGENAMAWFNS